MFRMEFGRCAVAILAALGTQNLVLGQDAESAARGFARGKCRPAIPPFDRGRRAGRAGPGQGCGRRARPAFRRGRHFGRRLEGIPLLEQIQAEVQKAKPDKAVLGEVYKQAGRGPRRTGIEVVCRSADCAGKLLAVAAAVAIPTWKRRSRARSTSWGSRSSP